jgi:transcription elongation factor GreA
MNDTKQYLTQEKITELNTELEQLRTVRRKEVAEHLEYAKKLGDLSENAEYQEAREEQAEVENRINHLEAVLKEAIVVDERKRDTAGIGSQVTVQKKGESAERTYRIVGSEESNTAEGKVSNVSPIGAALLGKKKGDTVMFQTPKGQVSYTIVSVA